MAKTEKEHGNGVIEAFQRSVTYTMK